MSKQVLKSSYSIKSISILVVDDDTTCLSIVAALLKSLKYQVVTVKHSNDALNILQMKENSFDLVITDVHMPGMNGFELQKQINKKFKLPVVFMSADDRDGVVVEGLQSGASFFIVKPVSRNDLKNLWQYVIANKKDKSVVVENETTQKHEHEKPCQKNTFTLKTISLIVNEHSNKAIEKKGKESKDEDTKDDLLNAVPTRKKLIWTNSLHEQFLKAVKILGLDMAAPKKILQIMNVDGLTREHVSSHLQKYRLFMRRIAQRRLTTQIEWFQSSSALEPPSNSLVRQPSLGESFPISKYPKLDLSSSYTYRHPLSNSSTLPSGKDSMNLLYNESNAKEPTKSLYDTKNLLYGTKHNFQTYGNSSGVVIGQEEPQLAQIGIDNGFNIDMLGSQNIGSIDHQKFILDPKFGVAELGTSENKGLEGSTDFCFENGVTNTLKNETMNTVPILGGTSGDNIPELGGSSSNGVDQLTCNLASQHHNIDNNVEDNVEIFEPVSDLSCTKNSFFVQQFNDHSDNNSTWMNQTTFQPVTQQPDVGEDHLQSLDPILFQWDEQEFLRSLLSLEMDGGDHHRG